MILLRPFSPTKSRRDVSPMLGLMLPPGRRATMPVNPLLALGQFGFGERDTADGAGLHNTPRIAASLVSCSSIQSAISARSGSSMVNS